MSEWTDIKTASGKEEEITLFHIAHEGSATKLRLSDAVKDEGRGKDILVIEELDGSIDNCFDSFIRLNESSWLIGLDFIDMKEILFGSDSGKADYMSWRGKSEATAFLKKLDYDMLSGLLLWTYGDFELYEISDLVEVIESNNRNKDLNIANQVAVSEEEPTIHLIMVRKK